jgi:colanic acid/amylovoran biosynthesis glycosyltransferase
MTERRSIAFVCATFPAFSETFVIREYRALAASNDFAVQACALRRPCADAVSRNDEDLVGETLYVRETCWIRRLGCHGVTGLRHPRGYLAACRALCRALPDVPVRHVPRYVSHWFNGVALGCLARRRRLDQLHGHFEAGGNLCFFAHLATGIPFSLTLHASDDLYFGPKPLLCAKVERAAVVLVDSAYNVRQVNLMTGYRYADRIHCVYNGVPLEGIRAEPLHHRAIAGLNILSVGSFVGVKGYPTALAALGLLKARGVPFTYRIIGDGDPAERAMIERLIAQHGIEDRVILLGRLSVEDVLREMRESGLLLMPSEIGAAGHRDGCPTVIAEAMLSGRLVVATWVSDIPNVITDGRTGFLVPEKAPEKLANVLACIAADPDRAATVAAAGAEAARKLFDAEARHAERAALLKRVVPERAAS